MKRLLTLALLLCLLCPAARADTLIDGRTKRNIEVAEPAVNTVPEGISPTTGRMLTELSPQNGFQGLAVTGRYMPMLVQIDNTNGGVGDMAPWGVFWADIIYETALHSAGYTRLSALFSDTIPDAVGPIRSARVGHAWLRQEWDCGFMYYGGQTKAGSSIKKEFSKYGAKSGVVLFSGTDGRNKPWKQYYTARKGLYSPHNRNANAAAISALIPAKHKAAEHTLRFTDEKPAGGDEAAEITVIWGSKTYNSTLVYDPETGLYSRYMHRDSGENVLWVDRDWREPITFANVIVQYIDISYNGAADAPVSKLTGTGNADYFMGGRHLAGVWQRKDMKKRTVFYGPDGQEIALQRGRTLIIQLPMAKDVTYR